MQTSDQAARWPRTKTRRRNFAPDPLVGSDPRTLTLQQAERLFDQAYAEIVRHSDTYPVLNSLIAYRRQLQCQRTLYGLRAPGGSGSPAYGICERRFLDAMKRAIVLAREGGRENSRHPGRAS